jgi:hypothetical protein
VRSLHVDGQKLTAIRVSFLETSLVHAGGGCTGH